MRAQNLVQESFRLAVDGVARGTDVDTCRSERPGRPPSIRLCENKILPVAAMDVRSITGQTARVEGLCHQ
jgi:hypothetical protein